MARFPQSDPRDDERTAAERDAPISKGAAVPTDGLTLGRTSEREPVTHRGRTYRLGHADVRMLRAQRPH